jgi:hypothetical protein
MRGFIWTDKLAEQIAQDSGIQSEANVLAWLCLTVGPLALAGAIGVLMWWL